jgi:type II secretory pathway predicted ATPase ExeA
LLGITPIIQTIRAQEVVSSPAKFIQYPSQQEAFRFLDGALADRLGIAVLHGGKTSGKSALITRVAEKLQERSAVAVVDGSRMRPSLFLGTMLEQFGYPIELNSVDELLNMVSVFAVQQTRSRVAPVLILENVNHMFPATLCVLCKLAELSVNNRYAMRMILVADRLARRVIESPSMRPVADRIVGEYDLQPLSVRESLVYLFAKLRALGIGDPEGVFSYDICDELHAVTDGWPGRLDSIALAIADQEAGRPLRLEQIEHPDVRRHYDLDGDDGVPLLEVEELLPALIVTRAGKVVGKIRLTAERTLLGRSEVSDVVIDNEFVSKHHAMVLRSEQALTLVDLKSRNGTFVNSQPVQSKVLRNDDIISIGEYRLKVICPPEFSGAAGEADMADTAKMRNFEDARRERAEAAQRIMEMQQRKA